MDRRGANAVLWASVICVVWGIGLAIFEMVEDGRVHGPPSEVLILLGVLVGLCGQVMWRQAGRIEALERRLAAGPPERPA
jgi:hypothetical protein